MSEPSVTMHMDEHAFEGGDIVVKWDSGDGIEHSRRFRNGCAMLHHRPTADTNTASAFAHGLAIALGIKQPGAKSYPWWYTATMR